MLVTSDNQQCTWVRNPRSVRGCVPRRHQLSRPCVIEIMALRNDWITHVPRSLPLWLSGRGGECYTLSSRGARVPLLARCVVPLARVGSSSPSPLLYRELRRRLCTAVLLLDQPIAQLADLCCETRGLNPRRVLFSCFSREFICWSRTNEQAL